jgi:hypothetical protein
VADNIVQFGEEERRGATDVGGKKDVTFFTFLRESKHYGTKEVM